MAIIKGTSKKKEYYIVIIGCGRLGSRIAGFLSVQGHSVVVVDKDENSLQDLSYEFSGFSVLGEATELDTLKSAKLDKADIALVLTPDDNTNIMIALVAKEYFSTPRVIARVYDPNNLEIFSRFGIEIICPTLLAVDSVKQSLEILGDGS